ncbi:hypothetical protein VNO78_04818 [Psophocarpus tetragonolobus]|uniref:GH18 domain-containing protein n=1 Tax=Psophocarpus tetragonolobus TaxID=3891 RepID=A0AAN9TFA9_PSOTE
MSVNGSIFREYIGSKPDPEIDGFPEHIINKQITKFDFILGYATDEYVEKKGQGKFRANWDVRTFSVKSIEKLKAKYPNVKVVISIGGAHSDFAFNPQDKEIWTDMAKGSLKDILLKQYKSSECECTNKSAIDGIDIHYDYIQTTEDDFVHCIGKVVDYLKSHIDGLVVSISPSKPVLSHYERLYLANTHRFHLVNYQYYHEIVKSREAFENLHKNLIDTFTVQKVLAGFSTDQNFKDNIPLEVFLEACDHLLKTASLAGIFVSEAQDSIVYHPSDFYVEKKSQQLLTGSDD